MDHQAKIEKAKYRNWVKGRLAYKYLKQGIEGFADEVVLQEHNRILHKINHTPGFTCNQCSLRSLRPKHKSTGTGKCPWGQVNCSCLDPKMKPCPNRMCDAIMEEILQCHGSHRPTPNWKNTVIQKWCSSRWEVAKCFINSPGYSGMTTASDIDSSGLLQVLINNIRLHSHFSSTVSGTDVLTKTLKRQNTIFNSPTMELEDKELNDCIDDIIDILEDDKELKQRSDANRAVEKLKQLTQASFVITTDNESEVCRDAMVSIMNISEERKEMIQSAKADTDQTNKEVGEVIDDKTQLGRHSDSQLPAMKQTSQILYEKEKQTSSISEYTHLITSLEVYPRVRFFRNRYNDLLDRFKAVKGKYSNIFGRMNLLPENIDAHDAFPNMLEVKVVGGKDLNPKDYIVADSTYYKVKPSCDQKEGTDGLCDYILADDPYLDKSKMHTTTQDFETHQSHDFPSTPRINIVILYAVVERLADDGLKEISFLIDQFANKIQQYKKPELFILCQSVNAYTDAEEDASRSDFLDVMQKYVDGWNHPKRIIIGNEGVGIKNEISLFLESQLVEGFVRIQTLLQPYDYSRKEYSKSQPSLLRTESCGKQIRSFLQSGIGLKDIKQLKDRKQSFGLKLLEKLTGLIRCAAVQPLADKYQMPVWICNIILIGLEFEQLLVNSVSEKTRSHLNKVYKFGKICTKNIEHIKKATRSDKTRMIDSIVGLLQTDMEHVTAGVEQDIDTFTTIVRKFLFEINGYMKKTNVVEYQKCDKEQKVNSAFRENILRREDVYGIGTIYGKLEIHVNREEDVSTVYEAVSKLMQNSDLNFSFIVRPVEQTPGTYAAHIKHGEILQSPCPGGKSLRKGTLGGFVVGSDKHLYALTCAHVVKGPEDTEHDVLLKGDDGAVHFAKSIPNMLVSSGSSTKPLIDIATIRVSGELNDRCVKFLKDEGGNERPAVLSETLPSDLVENVVYKYGADTSYTEGLVCSDDYLYNMLGNDTNHYIFLIDSKPGIEELPFAKPGDSGAIACIPNESNSKTLAVGIVNGGEFSQRKLCTSFRLKDGLDEIKKKSDGISFHFSEEYI